MSIGGRPACNKLFQHSAGVAQTMSQFPAAAVLLELAEPIRGEPLRSINVRHSTHQGTQNHFRMVLKN